MEEVLFSGIEALYLSISKCLRIHWSIRKYKLSFFLSVSVGLSRMYCSQLLELSSVCLGSKVSVTLLSAHRMMLHSNVTTFLSSLTFLGGRELKVLQNIHSLLPLTFLLTAVGNHAWTCETPRLLLWEKVKGDMGVLWEEWRREAELPQTSEVAQFPVLESQVVEIRLSVWGGWLYRFTALLWNGCLSVSQHEEPKY